ncbi:689_t:CDS:2 [Ambispora leptoticha]|uniref:689_t:CDS:1 n=1 Tax=Ambispora leptoticha TaxID=144679 RepID=A0A9N8VUL4_9GLOM|nr:689_t:CDS:2 [Ambispora leptoticha]
MFHIDGNKILRLIDKLNLDNILKYLSFHKHLNGICILLKPNDSRTTIVFRFYIQELLAHLHKSAKDNIVFCFTNARGTFYRPGDTFPPLKKHLKELQDRFGVEIKIKHDTVYCFDSESFRFLAALKDKVKFHKEEEKSFAESWKRSVNEAMRLLEYISKCPPHNIKDTLSLNESRNIVIILTKLLAEMSQLIETNIELIKMQQTEIKNINEIMNEECVKCVKYVKRIRTEEQNIYKIDYITHCHPHCNCTGAQHSFINKAALKECVAINSNGYCGYCKCHWSKHMHIRYETKTVIKNILDPKIKKQIYENKTDQERKQAIVEQSEVRCQQLEKEKETMEKIIQKLAQFLRENAIIPFNDAYVDYLDLTIIEEKQDITQLEQQLYELPINGEFLRKAKQAPERDENNAFKHRKITSGQNLY